MRGEIDARHLDAHTPARQIVHDRRAAVLEDDLRDRDGRNAYLRGRGGGRRRRAGRGREAREERQRALTIPLDERKGLAQVQPLDAHALGPLGVEPGDVDPTQPEQLAIPVGKDESPTTHVALHARRERTRVRHRRGDVGAHAPAEPARGRQVDADGREIDPAELQREVRLPRERRRRRGEPRGSARVELAAVAEARAHLYARGLAHGPRQILHREPELRHVDAGRGRARVCQHAVAHDVHAADAHRVSMVPRLRHGHPQRRRGQRQRRRGAAAARGETDDRRIAVDARPLGHRVIDLDARVDGAMRGLHRHLGREVESREPEVDVPQDRRRVQLERIEARLRHPRRDRRARHRRPHGRHTLHDVAAAREILRFDGEVPHVPRPRRLCRPLLQGKAFAGDGDATDGDGAVPVADILDLHADLGGRDDMRGATQFDVAQAGIEGDARPARPAAVKAMLDAERGVEHAALRLHRQLRRQVDPQQREVDVADDHRGLELDGCEADVAGEHRHLRARHARARGRDAGRGVARAGEIACLEGDAVDRPPLHPAEPRVFQRDVAAVDGKTLQRDDAGSRAQVVHGDPDRRRRHERAVLSGTTDFDAGEADVERHAAAGHGIVIDRRRHAHGPARRIERTLRRQRERRERDVDVPRRQRRAEMQRREPDVAHRERDRRAGHARAQRHDSGRSRGHRRRPADVRRDVHARHARRRHRLVFDRDRSALDDEVLDAQGEPAAPAPGLDEIGDVEGAGRGPHDPQRGRVQHAVEDPQVPNQEIARTEPHLYSRQRRERSAVAVDQVKVHEDKPAPEELELERVEAGGAARLGAELPHDDPAGHRGQREEATHREHEESGHDDDDQTEEAAIHDNRLRRRSRSLLRFGPSPPRPCGRRDERARCRSSRPSGADC